MWETEGYWRRKEQPFWYTSRWSHFSSVSKSLSFIFSTGYGIEIIWHPKMGARIVRFADDFVVLCKSDVDHPLALIKKDSWQA